MNHAWLSCAGLACAAAFVINALLSEMAGTSPVMTSSRYGLIGNAHRDVRFGYRQFDTNSSSIGLASAIMPAHERGGSLFRASCGSSHPGHNATDRDRTACARWLNSSQAMESV